MKTKILGTLTAFFAGASMALAQPSLAWPSPQDQTTRLPNVETPQAPANGSAGAIRATPLPTGGPVYTPPAATWHDGSPQGQCEHGGCGTDGCGPTYNFYGGIEYLVWWLRDAHVPDLVGVIPTAFASGGELPPGAINPIFGGMVGTGGHSGARLTVGCYFGPNDCVGVEASGFDLENGRRSTIISSQGQPVLGPLFIDPVQQRQVILLAAVPNERAGSVAIGLHDELWAAEANVRFKTVTVFSDATSVLVGFRTLQFNEGLLIANSSVANDPEQTTLTSFDSFATHNEFYGPQIGISSDFRWGSAFLNCVGKLAMGDVHEVVNIQGVSQQFASGQLQSTAAGGILAQPTNIGHHSRDRFAVVPEVNFNLGYQFGEHVRAFVGYDFLFINNVLRPGDQINPVDGRQVPNFERFDPTAKTTQPVFLFRETDMWAQGLNVGVEFRY
jgi:hypothetical protein